MIVFVDSDVVVTQRKHTGQRGYQRTRLTDAGVPRHVVPLIESAQAIRTVFEDIMRIQMAPDFLSACSVHCVSVCTCILPFCYLISTIIDFCIYSQPDVALELFFLR